MIDWTRVTGFDWEDGNARKIAGKHGVGQEEPEQPFFNEPLFLAPDPSHSQVEQGYHALGIIDSGRRLHIKFTLSVAGTLNRAISARDMNRKERDVYERVAQEAP